jgi:Tfp pilus assembly protein PilO
MPHLQFTLRALLVGVLVSGPAICGIGHFWGWYRHEQLLKAARAEEKQLENKLVRESSWNWAKVRQLQQLRTKVKRLEEE